MKKVQITPFLAAVLFVTACEGSGDPVVPPDGVPPVTQTADVRFFNAMTDMTGDGGFTANGQFAAGSALAFGEVTPTCSTIDADTTSFGFGAANAAGTGLSGNALATLTNQNITATSDFTVVATGSAASPTLFLFANTFSGSITANQAAVRFVNLAPGTDSTANTFNVFTGTFGSGHTLVSTNIAVGAPTIYKVVTSGSNTFSVLRGHTIVIPGSALTLQGGSKNTLAIVPDTTGGFGLINIPGC